MVVAQSKPQNSKKNEKEEKLTFWEKVWRFFKALVFILLNVIIFILLLYSLFESLCNSEKLKQIDAIKNVINKLCKAWKNVKNGQIILNEVLSKMTKDLKVPIIILILIALMITSLYTKIMYFAPHTAWTVFIIIYSVILMVNIILINLDKWTSTPKKAKLSNMVKDMANSKIRQKIKKIQRNGRRQEGTEQATT